MSTRLEMATELSDRGFDSLSAARRATIVNAAVSEVDLAYPWPYREETVEGTPPLAIADLEQIEAVTDENQDLPLRVVSYLNLLHWEGDLETTGTPWAAYKATVDGVPTIQVFPVSTTTIGVSYFKVPAALSADGDIPLAPTRFHGTYLAVASRMAAVETGGDPTLWAQEAERGLQTMMNSLLPDELAGRHQIIDLSSATDW